jgi:hypothetical protein
MTTAVGGSSCAHPGRSPHQSTVTAPAATAVSAGLSRARLLCRLQHPPPGPQHDDHRRGPFALVAAIVDRTSTLPHAPCRDLAPWFDATNSDDATIAIAICELCPELEPCRRSARTQQLQAVIGVELHTNLIDRTKSAKQAGELEIAGRLLCSAFSCGGQNEGNSCGQRAWSWATGKDADCVDKGPKSCPKTTSKCCGATRNVDYTATNSSRGPRW